MDQAKALEILKGHGKALAVEMIELVLKPALDEYVAKSENKIDDLILAAMEPQVLAIIKEKIAAL